MIDLKQTDRSGAEDTKGQPRGKRHIPPVYFTVTLLVIVGLLFYLGNRNFLSPFNINTIISFSAILLMVALGQMCAILVGGIDLSVGGLVSFISVTFIVLIEPLGYWAYPACILMGAAAGFINGIILTGIRIPSFIVTMATGFILTSLAYFVSPRPLTLNPGLYHVVNNVINGDLLGVDNVLWIGFSVLAMFFVFLRFTRTGRNIYYIGSNIKMSWMSGISTARTRITAFVLSGTGAAITALLITAVRYGGDPMVGGAYVLNSIAAVVVGGTALTGGAGGVINTVFGAIFMTMLENGMIIIGIDQYFHQIILGVMVIVCVTLTLDRTKIPIVK